MNLSNRYCVIMAGGIGSRFWPMSTIKHPKQFQDILGTGRTMIQQTFDRISGIVPRENIFVVTNKEYVELCALQLPELPIENIVGEPLMKNTAACNLYMANKIAQVDSSASVLVVPADHLILKEQLFHEKVELAFGLAATKDYLITMGIQPTRPDTGYGYIQYLANETDTYFKVKTFTEKPDLEIAKAFWKVEIFCGMLESLSGMCSLFLQLLINTFPIWCRNLTPVRTTHQVSNPVLSKSIQRSIRSLWTTEY